MVSQNYRYTTTPTWHNAVEIKHTFFFSHPLCSISVFFATPCHPRHVSTNLLWHCNLKTSSVATNVKVRGATFQYPSVYFGLYIGHVLHKELFFPSTRMHTMNKSQGLSIQGIQTCSKGGGLGSGPRLHKTSQLLSGNALHPLRPTSLCPPFPFREGHPTYVPMYNQLWAFNQLKRCC